MAKEIVIEETSHFRKTVCLSGDKKDMVLFRIERYSEREGRWLFGRMMMLTHSDVEIAARLLGILPKEENDGK